MTRKKAWRSTYHSGLNGSNPLIDTSSAGNHGFVLVSIRIFSTEFDQSFLECWIVWNSIGDTFHEAGHFAAASADL